MFILSVHGCSKHQQKSRSVTICNNNQYDMNKIIIYYDFCRWNPRILRLFLNEEQKSNSVTGERNWNGMLCNMFYLCFMKKLKCNSI